MILFKEYIKTLPLDHLNPKNGNVNVYAREVYSKGNEKADIFVYLQGGPGFSSPKSLSVTPAIKVLLKKYRVLLFDQRGTGKSDKIGPETCPQFSKPSLLANYFTFFRADQIVYDLEYFREKVFKVKKWFLLAQSYGGFISFTYLSFFPEAIKGAILCGGIPPLLENSVSKIYDKLTDTIVTRNREFYQKYPQEKDKVKKIISILNHKPYVLPDGSKFTPDIFLDLGMILGTTGGLDLLHYILDDPFTDWQEKHISYIFARSVINRSNFETNPIYAVLHESIYCDGITSQWAADYQIKTKKAFALNASQIIFYGETIRQSMFNDYHMLKPFRKVADIIAKKSDWGRLYDHEKLSKNSVPVEAIIYQTDYYVDFEFSKSVCTNIPEIKSWKHPKWQHDSLRTHGKEIITKLLTRLIKRV